MILGQEAGIQTRDFFGGLNGTRATIDIRGFGSVGTQNSLILIDGRRLNDIDLANVDLGKIPIENIERIEIIRGNAGSVLYGDGAVGGVINFVTKAETEKPTEANLEISYGSERRKEIKFSTSKRIGGYSSRLFLNSIYSDGYRDNNNYIQRNFAGEVKRSGNQGNIFIKLGLDDSSLGLPGARQVNRPAGIDLVSTDPTGAATQFDIALQNGIDLTIGGTYQLDNNTEVIVDTDEFTAVCPWTGLPDYGTLEIAYVPDQNCIELKSLKYYLLSYRDVGIVQEHAVNRILKDLVQVCQPRSMRITLDYKIRGGLHTSVSVECPRGGAKNPSN